MYLSGFADEAADGIEGQIQAIRALGWTHIECRNINGVNLTCVDDKTFDNATGRLADAGITIGCYGSGVANWSRRLSDPPDTSFDELTRAIPRMQRTGTKLIRIMSFAVPEDRSIDAPDVVREVVRRIKIMAKMAEDGGIILGHENCNSWGGRSYEHTLRLLDAVPSPALKLIFDTGNPVSEKDVRGEPPFCYQNAWEFYEKVKEHVVYVHIKDAVISESKVVYRFPGEGDGCVRRICADLKARGYDGGFSIEPHLAVVVHDPSAQAKESVRFNNFVEYGRRFGHILVDAGYKL